MNTKEFVIAQLRAMVLPILTYVVLLYIAANLDRPVDYVIYATMAIIAVTETRISDALMIKHMTSYSAFREEVKNNVG